MKPEQIMEVARLACAPDDTMGNMPFDVEPEDLYAAIMGADALGRYYTEEYNYNRRCFFESKLNDI